VENSIRYAALTVLSTDEQHRAISVGYFAIEGFRSKLAFANAMIGRFAGTALASEWEALSDRATKASVKRNMIAHRTVCDYPAAKAARGVLLVPWRYPKPNRNEFEALSCAILNWAHRASGKTERIPKAAETAILVHPR
jgi:hypothetical protein